MTCMLEVSWRDCATFSPTRCVSAARSPASVRAWPILTVVPRVCEWMVCTTVLLDVARKPTIRRPVSGPIDTGRVDTGLYSECAPAAETTIDAARAAPPSTDHRLPIMKRPFRLFTHRQPTNPRGSPMRTVALKCVNSCRPGSPRRCLQFATAGPRSGENAAHRHGLSSGDIDDLRQSAVLHPRHLG